LVSLTVGPHQEVAEIRRSVYKIEYGTDFMPIQIFEMVWTPGERLFWPEPVPRPSTGL
jgi:hypothetical protein